MIILGVSEMKEEELLQTEAELEHHHKHEHHHHDDHCCEHDHEHEHHHHDGHCCEHDHEHEHHHHHDHCCEHDHEHEHHHHDGYCCDDDGCGCGHDHGRQGKMTDWLFPVIGLAAMIVVSLLPFAENLTWLKIVLYGLIYLFVGREVLMESCKHIARGKIFDENFLMAVASLGAFIIGEYPEAIAVMVFYNIGEFCQNSAVRRSRRSVSDLMDIRPDYANLLSDGKEKRIPPEQAKVGDIILIRPGERVPLDCCILEGSTTVNTAALTGESLPAECKPGDSLMSGCVNITGVIKARVEKSFAQSTVSKVLALMEESSGKKAKPERFISRFAKIYTPVVCGIALLTAVIPPLFNHNWSEWIYTALTFLVISCPCALVISVPLSYVGGIGNASRHGILVKGSTALEQLPSLSDLICDKTGTITEGSFTVQSITSYSSADEDEILSLAATAEQNTTHPIGRSIFQKALSQGLKAAKIENGSEIPGKGVIVTANGAKVIAGNRSLLALNGVLIPQNAPESGTTVFVAKDGSCLGCITLADQIRPQAKTAFAALQKSGVRCTMLTGDRKETAQKVAESLSLAGFKAELLPQDKVGALEEIMQSAKGSTAFVGDGINDAPVLARADIGVAMGEIGSDAALEAADVVIMKDDLRKIPLAVKLARQTKAIVYQNITFALGVKLLIIVLGFFHIANMWLAVFADVGVALLAILNAVRPLFFRRKEE